MNELDFTNRAVNAIEQQCGKSVAIAREIPLRNGANRSRADLVISAPPFLYIVELKAWQNVRFSIKRDTPLEIIIRQGGAQHRYPDPRQQLHFMAGHLQSLRNEAAHQIRPVDSLPAWYLECVPQLLVLVDDANEVPEDKSSIPILTLSGFLERLPQKGTDIGIGPDQLKERVAYLETLAAQPNQSAIADIKEQIIDKASFFTFNAKKVDKDRGDVKDYIAEAPEQRHLNAELFSQIPAAGAFLGAGLTTGITSHTPMSPKRRRAATRGRTELIATIIRELKSQRAPHQIITGPRRFGRTALLESVAAKLKGEELIVEWIDLHSGNRDAALLDAICRDSVSDRVIMVDDADALWTALCNEGDQPGTNSRTIQRLHQILSSPQKQNTICMTTNVAYHQAPTWNFATHYALGPFNRAALRGLYSGMFKDNKSNTRIAEFASEYLEGHPYHSWVLRNLCQNRASKGKQFKPKKAKEMLSQHFPNDLLPIISLQFSGYLVRHDFKPTEMPRRFREESDQLVGYGLFRRCGSGIEPYAAFVRELLIPAMIPKILPMVEPTQEVDPWQLFFDLVIEIFDQDQLKNLLGLPENASQILESAENLRDFLSREFLVNSVGEVFSIVMGERDRRKLAQHLNITVGEARVDQETLLAALHARGGPQ